MKKGLLPFVMFGASSLLLSGCGSNRSQNSLGSQSYTGYCQVDSSFSFSGGNELAAFFAQHSAGEVIKVSYSLTSDTAINIAKTYFTHRADGAYVPVNEPVVANLGGYFEKGNDEAIEAVFEAASSRDIYPNRLVYHYLDKADYLTSGTYDWYKDPNNYDHLNEVDKTAIRYSAPGSLLVDATVSASSTGYYDYTKDGTPEVAVLTKNGEAQTVRTGSCELKDQIVSAYGFTAASASINGSAIVSDPSAYDFKVTNGYSHALFADKLTLAHSSAYLSSIKSYLTGSKDFVDATSLTAFLNVVGGQYSYSARCYENGGVKGFEVSYKEQRIAIDNKNTPSDASDDETIKNTLNVTYVVEGEAVKSFLINESTTSKLVGGSERTLTSHEESSSFNFDPSYTSFTGNKIDYASFPSATNEDFGF